MNPHRLVLFAITAIVTFTGSSAFAQADRGRVEVGGGASVHRLTRSDTTSAGLTGRFSFDITNWLAAEAEVTFFPSDDIVILDSVLTGDIGIAHHRRRTDGFVGFKFGHRGARSGFFGKVRPGFTHLTNRGMECVGEDCARVLILFAPDRYRTEFALDIGGGFEFYPSRRTVARFEFGDTVIRHRSFAPPCWTETCTSHNFTTRIGGGVRF